MNKQNKAFTLVELIVVITIIAILGTIAFISLQGYSAQSRDSVRISDVSNMKISLELFHLNSGKYPLPDNYEIVDYNTELLWYQGTFGSTVVSQLSRNMNHIPKDPLTDKEYIFSTANNKNEFEILTLLEGDLVLNTISQTNATTLTVTPRVDGNYNGVFIKTEGYIVPTPSIITSEEINTGGITLNATNIKSQIIDGGENIPNVGNVNYNTGALIGLELSVYNGTINKDSDDTEKENVMLAIQAAYTGSTLANNNIYEYILSKTTTEDLVALSNTVVLDSNAVVPTTTTYSCDDTTKPVDDLNKEYTVNPISENQAYVKDSDECGYACTDGYTGINCDIAPNPYSNCTGVNTPPVGDANIITTTTYGLCDTTDIIVCSGTGVGYMISACNVGTDTASTSYNDVNGYGQLFQWGNNEGIKTAGISNTQILITNIDSTYNGNGYFIYDTKDWNTTQNDNLWGKGTNTDEARKGPCLTGYHVPTLQEWQGIHTAGGWASNGLNMSNALKLPMAGYRDRNATNVYNQGSLGYYWSSSTGGTGGVYGFNMYFKSDYIGPADAKNRANGQSVRCFKN
ncbi:MAG: prepilin-type N-terminal cleavage/methylation domain-containing protein [Candidatus Gracilibacteria bacterium]